jgi:ADP-ribosylation factor GTPase-activating protein 1
MLSQNASQTFNRFVEGSETSQHAAPEKKDFWDSFGAPPKGPDEDKRDFWDNFSDSAAAKASADTARPSSIGTSAMGKGAPGKKKDDEWGEW